MKMELSNEWKKEHDPCRICDLSFNRKRRIYLHAMDGSVLPVIINKDLRECFNRHFFVIASSDTNSIDLWVTRESFGIHVKQ
jgi:hypothetical protein